MSCFNRSLERYLHFAIDNPSTLSDITLTVSSKGIDILGTEHYSFFQTCRALCMGSRNAGVLLKLGHVRFGIRFVYFFISYELWHGTEVGSVLVCQLI